MKSITLLLLSCFIALSFAVTNPTQAQLDTNDNAALNYALTLEQLEAAFYNQFLATFNAAAFSTAGYAPNVYTYLTLVRDHENAHVTALTSTIQQRQATPVQPCTYNFTALGPLTTIPQYLGLAKVFENVGVTAYDGAINRIYDLTLQQVAATIATVEARHAAFLNLLASESPFPNATDAAVAPATVASTVTPFLISCPSGTPPLPSALVVIPVAAPSGSANQNPTQIQLNINDLNALNYALTLEHLEATFYQQYQAQYNAAAFSAAGYAGNTYSYFNLIRDHETAHVSALVSTIQGLGGVPVQACTSYNFGVTSVATYVATARILENVGVTAYDGAVNTIFNGALKQYAATIATVEARHAAYLNNLTGLVAPFPSAFDNATAPVDIVGIVTPLLGNCPTPLTPATLPVARRVFPFNNDTTTTTSTTGSSTTTNDASSSSLFSLFSVLLVVVASFAAL